MSTTFEDRKPGYDWIIAKWRGRCGIADSQLFMRHWTPEFYEQKMAQYKREFNAELAAITATADP